MWFWSATQSYTLKVGRTPANVKTRCMQHYAKKGTQLKRKRLWKPPHTGLSHDADVSFSLFCLMSWCLSWRSWCAAALTKTFYINLYEWNICNHTGGHDRAAVFANPSTDSRVVPRGRTGPSAELRTRPESLWYRRLPPVYGLILPSVYFSIAFKLLMSRGSVDVRELQRKCLKRNSGNDFRHIFRCFFSVMQWDEHVKEKCCTQLLCRRNYLDRCRYCNTECSGISSHWRQASLWSRVLYKEPVYEYCFALCNPRGRVVGWGIYAACRNVTGSSPDEVDFFQFTKSFQPALRPWGRLSL
jgi:hypothetical protein